MLKRINLRSVAAVALAVGFAFFGLNLGHPAHASTSGNPIVTVGNTSANPVPVTGSVTGTITGNVSVTNTPNVSISNTPSVSLSGTPTVNLGNPVVLAGTPSVNLANGASVNLAGTPTVNPAPILDNFPNVIAVPSLDPGTTQNYPFLRTVMTSCLIIATANDIDVILGVNPPNGIQYDVPLGRIHPTAGPLVINFTQPLPIQHVTVSNPGFPNVIHATFAISAIGN